MYLNHSYMFSHQSRKIQKYAGRPGNIQLNMVHSFRSSQRITKRDDGICFFSSNTKIWLDLILSIVEIKDGLHRYIITSLRLSIWLSISSQYKSRLRIIEARPFIRAQDRILNSDAITLESLRPNLELLARHSLTISLSATGSQKPRLVTLRALNEKPASLAWFPMDLSFLSLPTVAAYWGSVLHLWMRSGRTADVTTRSNARVRGPSP